MRSAEGLACVRGTLFWRHRIQGLLLLPMQESAGLSLFFLPSIYMLPTSQFPSEPRKMRIWYIPSSQSLKCNLMQLSVFSSSTGAVKKLLTSIEVALIQQKE